MLLPEGLHGARHNIQPADFLSLLPAPRRRMDVPADLKAAIPQMSPLTEIKVDGANQRV
jgi:hypothetical protein